MKFESIRDICAEMEQDDAPKVQANQEYDDMIHMLDELPPEWINLGWIRKIVSSEPYDIVRSATRILSTKAAQLSITPILDNPETRAYFNRIERSLKWQYKLASKRAQSFPTRDVVESILRYDDIATNVIYLPYQDRALEAIHGKRKKAALQYGPFAIKTHKSSSAHVRFSDYMQEIVYLKNKVHVNEIISFWGDRAKELAEKYKDADNEYVYVNDFTMLDQRCVWIAGESRSEDEPEFMLVKPEEKYDIPFLPWVCRVGGTSMDTDPEEQRQPILYSNRKTGTWHNQNLFGSLMYSLAMYRAAMPVDDVTSPDGEGIEIDATQPAGQQAHNQSTTVKRLPPAGIDPVVQQMYDRLQTAQGRSAGTRVLQTGEIPQGAAFATVNATMQAATATLDPAKDMAENSIADIFGLMVQWFKFNKDPILYIEDDPKSKDYGKPDKLSYDHLPEPQDLYINVALEKYVPVDEMSKVNSAVMLTSSFPYPSARALENLGVSDPEQAFKEWEQEQLDKNAVQTKIRDMDFEQQMMQQEQMGALQLKQQMDAMAAQGQGQGGGVPAQPGTETAPSFDQTGGQGFNPALGGSPPAMGSPDVTREAINGGANPMTEGADMRGLGVSPEEMLGRRAVQ